ncbi:glycosyltransferase [Planctopirus hydrillae]|uniref:glycosyltransferase n=1 Tax=Planctopirus hydrillae TaxID=1841610 RepID=UPI0009F33E7B|nr:glycosyltransferase [Planctopirus hydrillae]
MKILHIINSFELGGAQRALQKIVRYSSTKGISSSVVSLTSRGNLGEEFRSLGCDVDCIRMDYSLAVPVACIKLFRLLNVIQPDVVVTWLYQSDFFGGLLAKCVTGKVPVVWNLRTAAGDDIAGRTARFFRFLCASVSRWIPSLIIGNSPSVLSTHERLKYPKDKLRMIPNGFDSDLFRSDPLVRKQVREELQIANNEVLFGMVARRHKSKDHESFLRAAVLTCAQVSNAKFVLFGHGISSDDPVFQEILKDCELRSHFHFLQPRSDVKSIQMSLDVGVLMSNVDEGFPNSIGEAMACGVPCIVSDTGGSSFVVGNCGVVVPKHSVDKLHEAMLEFVSKSEASRLELGLSCRERIVHEFGIEETTMRHIDSWREVLTHVNAKSQ